MTAAVAVLPAATRRRILAYLGGLVVLLSLGIPEGGLLDVPISFILKNRLHLDSHEVAQFRAWAALPLYVSFLFGFARDLWRPREMGDRGLIVLFGALAAAIYGACALAPVSYGSLLATVILASCATLFSVAAQNGLTTTLGQQHAMTGQVSASWNIFGSLPAVAALVAGGWFSEWLEEQTLDLAVRTLFLAGAASNVLVALYALPRPRAVFDNLAPEPVDRAHPFSELVRLVKWRPAWPGFAIWLLWNFAPGSTTPLQYHLQNTLHAGDAQWGVWNAIYTASFVPTFLLYGALCQRYPLRPLLFWGTLAAIPQFIPLLFTGSVTAALAAAVPIGLMGGFASAAYMDLIMRSSPPGLQGATLMMAGGLYHVSTRFGDLLGTRLYEAFGGFSVCVASITIVYALILPTLRFAPAGLVDRADGIMPPIA